VGSALVEELTMSDSILTDLGSLFFLVWSAVIAGVTVAAFGRDLFPSKARVSSRQESFQVRGPHPKTQ